MKVTALKIPDVKLFEPNIFNDQRGFFYESFNQQEFNDALGYVVNFVQDNHSHSKRGVLRGLHYQDPPFAQGKLVRVVTGEVFDVALNIRQGSATYGKWVGQTLSALNKKQLWIPEGFAHGFLTVSEEVDLLYKTTNYYSKDHESVIHWQYNDFGIVWPDIDEEIITSNKDSKK